jgi:hypothetical protein
MSFPPPPPPPPPPAPPLPPLFNVASFSTPPPQFALSASKEPPTVTQSATVDPMTALFEEIKARGRTKDATIVSPEPIIGNRVSDEDEDPRRKLAKEIAAAAAKRAARTMASSTSVIPMAKSGPAPPSTGFLAEIMSGPSARRRGQPRASDSNKVKRYKVHGLRCAEYMEDPQKPVDNVDVFDSMEECEKTRMYNVAREAILNTVLKYGNEVNEADAAIAKAATNLNREKERLERAKAIGDVQNIQNYTKSVANYALDISVAEEKKRSAQANFDKYYSFLYTNIMEPLSRGNRENTFTFYQHLKRLKPQVENWTPEYVAQEYVNYFKVPIPGYEVGGVSGLTSAQVKSVLLNSPLRECMTMDVLNDIMTALGASSLTSLPSSLALASTPPLLASAPPPVPSSSLDPMLTSVAKEEWFDAPRGNVQRSIFDKSMPRLWKSADDISIPISKVTRKNIIRQGIDTMMNRLHEADPRKLPSEAVENVLDILNEAERDIVEPIGDAEDAKEDAENTKYIDFAIHENASARIPGAFLPYMRGKKHAWMGGNSFNRRPAVVIRGGNGPKRMNVEYLRW